MDKRLIISVSFSNDKELYNYVKNQPNSSHYIRQLVKEDMMSIKEEGSSEGDFEEIALDILSW